MKSLRRIFSLGLLLVLFSAAVSAKSECTAQQKADHKSRVAEFMNQKKEFLIREVGMTREEADAFFPLYDELQKDKFKLHREVRDKVKKIQGDEQAVSEQAYAEAARSMNDLKLKEAKMENEYFARFAKILPPQKMYKLQVAENNFSKEMLRKGSRHTPKK